MHFIINSLSSNILSFFRTATAISAARHCGQRVELISVFDIAFLRPIHLGEVVLVRAQVIKTEGTRLCVGLDIQAESVDGTLAQALTASFTFATPFSDAGRRPEVPPLILTDEAEELWERHARLDLLPATPQPAPWDSD